MATFWFLDRLPWVDSTGERPLLETMVVSITLLALRLTLILGAIVI